MRLSLHPHAEQELLEAVRYYNSQSPDLGLRFSAECDAAAERICDAPERYSQLAPGARRFRLKRFPYSVVYRIKGEAVRVIAFSHHRRRPGYWRSRLSD